MSTYLAKLLATENIHVVKRSARTASFNVRTRTLVIPIFKNQTISEVVEHLFVEHEVGHALYTSYENVVNLFGTTESPNKENLTYKSAFNIVEDARIEKLIKRRYPGSKKDFYEGYVELREKDFFKIGNRDITKYSFLDRANLFFKGFVELYSSFSDAELDLLHRIRDNDDEYAVFDLAVEAYNLSLNNTETDYHENHDNGDGSECDNDGDESQTDSPKSSDDEDDIPSPKIGETDSNLQSSFSNIADTDIEYNTVELINDIKDEDRVIPYKSVLELFPCVHGEVKGNAQISMTQYRKFKHTVEPAIQSMVKEFEMKKSAKRFSYQQVSKTGTLDVDKLFSYKIKDDIFKTITTVRDSKNHGMMFMLDWSASMFDVIHNTLRQLYILTSFCRKVGIPFTVNAFSTKNSVAKEPENNDDSDYMTNTSGFLNMSELSSFHLIEFFSSEMTENEFESMWSRLFCITFTPVMLSALQSGTTGLWPGFTSSKHPAFKMGSTPLNSALVYLHTKIPQIKQKYNVEKFALVILTDGASDPMCYSKRFHRSMMRTFRAENGVIKRHQNYMVSLISPITKKEYVFSDVNGTKFTHADVANGNLGRVCPIAYETSAIIRMIKDTGVTTISINVVDNKKDRTLYAICFSTCLGIEASDKVSLINDVEVPNSFYDKALIVKDKSLVVLSIEDSFGDVDIPESAKAKAIAKKLSSSISKSKNSYLLYNSFIEAIS